MNYLRFILITVLVTLPLAYYSCDDSGQEPIFIPKGLITFTQTNLKTLDRNVDGYYQLWVRHDSLGSRYYSLGEFNIASNGSVVNLLQQPMEFKLPPNLDTNSLGSLKHALVTVEYSSATSPSNRRLISGDLGINDDSLWGSLYISGSEALGEVGRNLMTPPGPGPEDDARYILYTPSNNLSTCKQGAWFCDTNFNPAIPSGLAFPGNFGWCYEGWIKDKHDLYNIKYYSMGRFYNPYAADLDGAGPCSGLNSGFNLPGQDFIQTTGTCPVITNLADGLYEIFITLEPSSELNGQNKPFYLKLFLQDYISPTIPCKREDNIYKMYPSFPSARIKITN